MKTCSALLALCAGYSPASGEFPTQRPVTQSFDVFFDLCLNKRLNKQSWGWWFETPSRPLSRHGNAIVAKLIHVNKRGARWLRVDFCFNMSQYNYICCHLGLVFPWLHCGFEIICVLILWRCHMSHNQDQNRNHRKLHQTSIWYSYDSKAAYLTEPGIVLNGITNSSLL